MAAVSELYRRTIAVSEAGKRIRLKSQDSRPGNARYRRLEQKSQVKGHNSWTNGIQQRRY